eukprot:jgi/Orpsp1_1/1175768/evm.model.c7180000055130.1
MEYANRKHIILKINDKKNEKDSPVIRIVCKNSFETLKLLFDYASNNNIILNINEKDILSRIEKKFYGTVESISKIKVEIIELLFKYRNENKLNITFTENKTQQIVKKRVSQLLSSNLVIAIKDFVADEYDQLDITKGEFLIVTNWNCEEGWVYGYRKDNKEEKGLFPKIFVKVCNEDIIESPISKEEITPEYKIIFEEKVETLRSKKDMTINSGSVEISIRRNDLFNDIYYCIMTTSVDHLKRRLRVKYIGEEGIDAGGLL